MTGKLEKNMVYGSLDIHRFTLKQNMSQKTPKGVNC